jgi:BON domain-containing protein
MRRYLIVVAVVVLVGSNGQATIAQQRAGGTTGQGGFEVGGATGGGQGSAGNFGVGTAGQVDTNARFMRDNRQGAFVGADSADTGFVGGATAGNNRASTRNIRGGGGGAANVNQGGGRGRQKTEVRIVLQLGFTPPVPGTLAPRRAPEAVASRLAERMNRSSWIQNRSEMEVSIAEGTATLRGVVSTEHDRLLAERFALLEGGIRKVENLLEIESTPPDSEDVPALLEPTP